MDGSPPERMVTDSWPALHGRPVLRRTVAVGLVLCVSVAAALVVRGVNALTVGRTGHETDRDRAERLAGLHPDQHPGVGRYYVPVGAVYTHTSDGAPVAYLHYRLGGGKAPGVGDFLSAYDLPTPGRAAPLPPDLVAALGGDEPAEAPELSDGPTASPTPTTSPSASASPSASQSPSPACTPALAVSPAPEADPDAEPDPDTEAEPDAVPTPDPTATPEPSATTPTPTPTPTVTHAPTARRIYVAAIPGGLSGAADIYIRATG
ncbi:hypothetical protein [Kitasatospora sp. NPDC086791]|uniref:hypothetical protein n=1 Tax=Kitasatospora sp. NPDC086791 TaxID=3155178 RepID=UPI003440D295